MSKKNLKESLSPRKLPRQGRSQDTVLAIVEASAHILAKEGYARLSTNRIAEKAGVSIGSLYQYFPNKDSILSYLVDQYIEKQALLVQEHLAQVEAHNIREYASRLIYALYEFRLREGELQLAVTRELPRLKFAERLQEMKHFLAQIIAQVLEDLLGKEKDWEKLIFLVIQGCDSMIDGILFGSMDLKDDEKKILLDEVVEMALSRIL